MKLSAQTTQTNPEGEINEWTSRNPRRVKWGPKRGNT
jgi:hypothetical protein